MKKALAMVSFGTTYPEARNAIECVEKALTKRFSDYIPFRAFTSGMVIRLVNKQENIHIDTPSELFERLAREGYDEVLCQSLHIIEGNEFSRLQTTLAEHAQAFSSVRFGSPLLASEADYIECARALLTNLPVLVEHEALVLMGHGSDHIANEAYFKLEKAFRLLGHANVFVGTVEGTPTLNDVIACLAKNHIKKVYLAPFMLVAGDHAQNDLAGDEPDSWQSVLGALGYDTKAVLCGIGEFPEIARMFVAHCEAACPIVRP